MAGWIKMPHGREVHLGSSDIVLDGDPVPLLKKGAQPAIFGPFLLWPNGWMHQNVTWYGVGLSPGDFVLDGDPVTLPKKGAEFPQIFGQCLLWPNGQATLC